MVTLDKWSLGPLWDKRDKERWSREYKMGLWPGVHQGTSYGGGDVVGRCRSYDSGTHYLLPPLSAGSPPLLSPWAGTFFCAAESGFGVGRIGLGPLSSL